MNFIKLSYEIMDDFNEKDVLKKIEKIARVCYKTEEKITDESYKKFVRKLVDLGHEAMIEHFSFSVKFIANRGFTHELVRMRLASYAQESTRYCDYSKNEEDSGLNIAKPNYYDISYLKENYGTEIGLLILDEWLNAMENSENSYKKLRSLGVPAQLARDVLPIGIKAEIVITTNLREWRHIFSLRACDKTGKAHPIMHELMKPLLKDIKKRIPIIFDDLECKGN